MGYLSSSHSHILTVRSISDLYHLLILVIGLKYWLLRSAFNWDYESPSSLLGVQIVIYLFHFFAGISPHFWHKIISDYSMYGFLFPSTMALSLLAMTISISILPLYSPFPIENWCFLSSKNILPSVFGCTTIRIHKILLGHRSVLLSSPPSCQNPSDL